MKYTEDENGYITIPKNPISKSGVFQYLGKSISPELEPEKVYNVWRPEEELNNPETIESFRLTPWIPEHVMLGEGFTPAEVVGVQGVTGEEIEFFGGTLYSKLKLFGEDLKKLIKAGLKELSCGFRCQWEIQSGVSPEGKAYDVIQRQIRGNHLASVEQARMGSDVRVAMDRAVFALDSIDFKLKPNGEDMNEEEIKAAMDAAISPIQKALDEANKEIGELKKKAEDMDKDGEKDEKTAEDMEEEEKKKAADKEKSEAMDAAIVTLTKKVEKLQSTAMDGNAVMKAFAEKQDLANRAAQIVGAFDHTDMDAKGVAKHALTKMGVACDSGDELATFKGVLVARKTPTFTVDKGNALDSADSAKSDTLDKLGL
ncbi:hypothetical protein MAELSTROM_24 [Pseudoalteromonas phage Maelstrom]|uniref:head maturation protease n=1 Tax=Pseudoalteromonas phage Maelstrom TaxID=2065202 RepID=UPI000CA10706|nr:head maturation protease [Pseudoalteromonas phage Maelstrom]AUG84944.1 hypothetical protein MAELSTROM_24 [Pseudoalteromonas phage Maelstrom]